MFILELFFLGPASQSTHRSLQQLVYGFTSQVSYALLEPCGYIITSIAVLPSSLYPRRARSVGLLYIQEVLHAVIS
jgi:hypothetical protein